MEVGNGVIGENDIKGEAILVLPDPYFSSILFYRLHVIPIRGNMVNNHQFPSKWARVETQGVPRQIKNVSGYITCQLLKADLRFIN